MDKSINLPRLLILSFVCILLLLCTTILTKRSAFAFASSGAVQVGATPTLPSITSTDSQATSETPSIPTLVAQAQASRTAILTKIAETETVAAEITPTVTLTPSATLTPSVTPTSSTQVLTVTKLDDSTVGRCSSDCSLRDAIAAAPYGATISFARGLTGTIVLTNGEIQITKSMTIKGPGAKSSQITISGNKVFTIFSTKALVVLDISGLTFADANANGAISSVLGILHITDCTFQNNVGGAVSSDTGYLVVQRSTFVNTSEGSQAAIQTLRGTATIVDSTFYNNNEDSGAAILNSSGAMLIVNSTLRDDRLHGGILVLNILPGKPAPASTMSATVSAITPEPGQMVIINTILEAGKHMQVCNGQTVDGGHNLQFPGTSCGSSMPSANAKLAPLQDNGGPTQTLALLEGSPAIDAGDSITCAGPLLQNMDQRELPRSVEGTTGKGALCDIGAFEYNSH